jgi:hypothetical protein
MKRRSSELETTASAAQPPVTPTPTPTASDSAKRVRGIISAAARYEADLEHRYVAARDAWTRAMHAANSGRSADMASLAIAQEHYETIMGERERWLASARVAIPIDAPDTRHNLEVAVGQELEWRRVHAAKPPPGFLGRFWGRLRGR